MYFTEEGIWLHVTMWGCCRATTSKENFRDKCWIVIRPLPPGLEQLILEHSRSLQRDFHDSLFHAVAWLTDECFCMTHWWGLLYDSLSHVSTPFRQESLAWKHLLESIINHCPFKICDFCIYGSNVIVHMCWSLEGTYIHALVIGKYGGSRLWWRVVFFFSSYFRHACVFIFQPGMPNLWICWWFAIKLNQHCWFNSWIYWNWYDNSKSTDN